MNEISYREKGYISTSKVKELYQYFGKVQTAVILAVGEGNEMALERHMKLLKVNNVKKRSCSWAGN